MVHDIDVMVLDCEICNFFKLSWPGRGPSGLRGIIEVLAIFVASQKSDGSGILLNAEPGQKKRCRSKPVEDI